MTSQKCQGETIRGNTVLNNGSRHMTYLERLGKLFTGDERVHSGLLWRPSLDRVQVEQTLTEIDKRRAIVELYRGVRFARI